MIKKKCKYKNSIWQKWWAWRPIWIYTSTDKKLCTTRVWKEWVWRCKMDSWGDRWWEYSITAPEGHQITYPYNKVVDE